MLKRFSLFILMFFAFQQVWAEDDFNRWYARGFGGVNFTDSPKSNGVDRVDVNRGYCLGVAMGAQLSHWRFETEFAYRNNPFDVRAPGKEDHLDSYGYVSKMTLMGNCLHNFFTGSLTPFIGAGVGGRREESKTYYEAIKLVFDETKKKNVKILDPLEGPKEVNYQFAYQGKGGLSYQIAKRTDVVLEYCYLNTIKASSDHSISLILSCLF